MTVAFYISGHGFGHASRQVEIINALAARMPSPPRLLIRSAVAPELLARTLRVPYELRPGAVDTGIVQSSSVAHDDEATVQRAIEFYDTFDVRVDGEVRALAGDRVDLVVGDIPPLAFEAAAHGRIPSVAIANFTWDWVYETHPGFAAAAPWLLPRLRQAYATATRALELPFGAGFGVFGEVQRIPLVCRRAARSRQETRQHFGIALDRPAALLSFGGYGMPSLDLASLDCLDTWTVVTTDRSTSRPAHASGSGSLVFAAERAFVSSAFRYEDLVAAADVVVTKPGYRIISECVAANTAMLYTSRGQFREYDLLVRELPRYLRARFIAHDDLFAGRWRAALDALAAQPAAPETIRLDGAAVAADVLARMLG